MSLAFVGSLANVAKNLVSFASAAEVVTDYMPPAQSSKSSLLNFDISRLSADPVSTMLVLYIMQIGEVSKVGIYDNLFGQTPPLTVGASLGYEVSIPCPENISRTFYKLDHDQIDQLEGIVGAFFKWYPLDENRKTEIISGSVASLEKLKGPYKTQSLTLHTIFRIISNIQKGYLENDGSYLLFQLPFYLRVRAIWTTDEIQEKMMVIFHRVNEQLHNPQQNQKGLIDYALEIVTQTQTNTQITPISSVIKAEGHPGVEKLELFKTILREEFSRFINFGNITIKVESPEYYSGIDSTTAEPFSTILMLGLLLEEEENSKVHFSNCTLQIDPNSAIASITRPREGRHQLSHLEGIITAALCWYPRNDKRFTLAYDRAKQALENLKKKTYAGSAMVEKKIDDYIRMIDHPETVDFAHLYLPIKYYSEVRDLWNDEMIQQINQIIIHNTISEDGFNGNRAAYIAKLQECSENLKKGLQEYLNDVNELFQKILGHAAVDFVSYRDIRTDEAIAARVELSAEMAQVLYAKEKQQLKEVE